MSWVWVNERAEPASGPSFNAAVDVDACATATPRCWAPPSSALERLAQVREAARQVLAHALRGRGLIAALERADDRVVLRGGALDPGGLAHVDLLVAQQRALDRKQRGEQVLVAAAGRERAVELVVGRDGRGRIVARGAEARVGAPQRVQRRRVEWRRLAHREALEHDDGRVEPARLADRQRGGAEHSVRDAIDDAVELERRERRPGRGGADAEPLGHRGDLERLAGR